MQYYIIQLFYEETSDICESNTIFQYSKYNIKFFSDIHNVFDSFKFKLQFDELNLRLSSEAIQQSVYNVKT